MRVANLACLLLSFCHADANGPVCTRATGRHTLYPFVAPSITPPCIVFRWTWLWQSSTKNQGGTRMRSPVKGAVGLMQLMPKTAVRFGMRNRFRPDENIRGGVAYLAWLISEFGGDLRLVAAAYCVGEDPISRRKLDYSCADIQGYVKRVAKRYRARRRRAVEPGARKRARR